MPSKGEKTKARILERATDLMHRRGLGATSLNDLMAETDLKKGSLYFHFKDKEALALAVLDGARSEFNAFLETSLCGATPGARLDRFFRAVVERHQAEGFVGGCIFGNTALETSGANERFSAFISNVFDDWTKRLSKEIGDAKRKGEVRSSLPAAVLARHAVAAIEGGIMLARVKKTGKPLEESLRGVKTLLGRG